MLDFIYERLRGYLREQGYTANEIDAVLSTTRRPRSTTCLARLAAVREFSALPEAAALAAANKRIVNILRKSGSDAGAVRRALQRCRRTSRARHSFPISKPLAGTRDFRKGDFSRRLRALADACRPSTAISTM